MEEQLIISLGREYGSGGHVIAQRLADYYEIPMYNNDLLKNIAAIKNVDERELRKYDEKKRNRVLSRSVKGYSNSPEEVINHMQFEYLKKMSSEGRSFVIVGRCSEEILKPNPHLITIFIIGDMDFKIRRTADDQHISLEEAKKIVISTDKKRKAYHNSYCKGKWGDCRNYDLTINSSKLGIDVTTEIIKDYIDKRIQNV